MPIEFFCRKCGKRYRVDDRFAGRPSRCTACGETVTVPPVSSAAAGPSAPPVAKAVFPSVPPPLPPRARNAPPPLPPPARMFAENATRCPSCGSAQPAGAVFCTACGFDRRTNKRSQVIAAGSAPGKGLQTWQIVAAGGVIVLVVLVFAVVQSIPHARRLTSNGQPASGGYLPIPTPEQPFLPTFPERGAAQPTEDPGVVAYPLVIGGVGPGLPMHVRLYLPAGTHAAGSLPCVFIAPAGTRMVHGSSLGDGDSPEHLPYVRAGFAVCAYELSGDVPDRPNIRYIDLAQPIREFTAANGGLANARGAIEFVLAKVPEVNPAQLYAAGHSSAATMALDFAAADHRIAACVAYAPGCDVVGHLSWGMSQMERVVPGTAALAARVSPMLHINDIQCPVYLFHADDDTVVSLDDNQRYVNAMRAAGKTIDFVRVRSGNHYQSMIRDGIPGGIRWLIEHGANAVAPSSVATSPPGSPLPGFTPAGPPGFPGGPPSFAPPRVPGPPPVPNIALPPALEAPVVRADGLVTYHGYQFQLPADFQSRGGAGTTWIGPRHGANEAKLTLQVRPRTDRTSPTPFVMTEVGHSPPGVHGVTAVIGGVKDEVTINGLRFVRARRHPQPGNMRAYTVLYTAYDDAQWITLSGSCSDDDTEMIAKLDAAAASIGHVP